MILSIALLVLSIVGFFAFYFWERRSIFISLLVLNIIICIGVLVVSSQLIFEQEVLRLLLILLGMLILLMLMMGPFAFLVLLYINGFRILRREGVRFHNFLSLGLAVGVTIYLFLLPLVTQSLSGIAFFNFLFFYIGIWVAYGTLVSALYTTSSFINLVNLFPRKLDYVVVLGAGLNGEEVTPLLASRINKGIAIYKKNPGSRLIMSGGQGFDEVIAEAEAMKRYAVRQGVKEQDIVMENKSTNTEENIRFSHALMEPGSRFALVTNAYHVFRALLLARQLKIKCIGYGARTKFYFSLNAFIREFVGYLVMSRRYHLAILGLFSLLYTILLAISLLPN